MKRFKIIIASLCLFIIAMLITTCKLTVTCFSLTRQAHILSQESQPQFMPDRKKYITQEKSEWLEPLIHLAESAGLQVMSVTTEKNPDNAGSEMFFQLQGSFSGMMSWLKAATHQHIPICIDGLVITTAHNVENIKIKMRTLNKPVDVSVANHEMTTDPFLKEITVGTVPDASSVPIKTSIEQVKFAGFLKSDKKQLGILLLPDGSSIDVCQGDSVGTEHAEVTHIDEDKIIFNVNGKAIIKTMTQF